MATDNDIGNADERSPTNRSREKAALLHETAEALTALGSYLAAAHGKFQGQFSPTQDGLGEALEKSLGQYERASKAVRRLCELFRHESASNDDRPGFH